MIDMSGIIAENQSLKCLVKCKYLLFNQKIVGTNILHKNNK